MIFICDYIMTNPNFSLHVTTICDYHKFHWIGGWKMNICHPLLVISINGWQLIVFAIVFATIHIWLNDMWHLNWKYNSKYTSSFNN
jgi:hypothetical protein